MKTILSQLAQSVIDYASNLNGENATFEVSFGNYAATVEYRAEISGDDGDYWTAPSWSIDAEEYIVRELWDDDTERLDLAGELEDMLND